MDSEHPLSRFSQIPTDPGIVADPARIVIRYGRAMRAYIASLLQRKLSGSSDVVEDAVEECASRMALKIQQGKLATWNPAGGKFRFYFHTIVTHEVEGFLRERRRDILKRATPIVQTMDDSRDEEKEFLGKEVFRLAVEALRDEEARDPHDLYASVLTLRLEHPDASAAELAGLLEVKLRRSFTEIYVRQIEKRARTRFAELLVLEVRRMFGACCAKELQEELCELGLWPYVERFIESSNNEPGN